MPFRKSKKDQLTLYYHPMSFYSQIARLALEEKQLQYASTIVDIGPSMENYEPWYMRINPRGVVPTLDHNGKIVTDAMRIIRYVSELPLGAPSLLPQEADEQEHMEAWLKKLDAFPVREFSYSHVKGILGKLARKSFSLRRRAIRKLIERNPDLKKNYEARLKDIDAWEATIADANQIDKLVQGMDKLLVELEQTLGTQSWAAGSTYSLADLVWTIFLERIAFVKPDLLKNRPNIAAYHARLKRRPSYAKAQITQKPSLRFKLRTIRKALPRLLHLK